MKQYNSNIVKCSGEGVMLRKPQSKYEHGRSHSILKYKVKTILTAKDIRQNKPDNFLITAENTSWTPKPIRIDKLLPETFFTANQRWRS